MKTQETLNEALKRENKNYKETIKYISKQENLNPELVTYNYDDLYALIYRDYENYEYGKYVSLVLKDYNYSCFDLLSFYRTRSYVFNVEDGTVMSEENLLKKYNITMDEIKNLIRNELNKSQTTEDGVDLIKIDDTLNDFSNYGLYINDYGKLCITYLVKSNNLDYNLSMEVS